MPASAASASPRIDELFNFGWRFLADDHPSGQEPALDDAGWRMLDLPHDFQIEQPWSESAGGGRGFKEMGVGWYRKHFRADPAWRGRRVLLEFEGIMLFGDVWLNGHLVAENNFGYLGSEADITGFLDYDGDNVVAVRASTGESGQSRWYTGGGLFRDVRLIVKDPISVGRHGVYVTTPQVSADQAQVSVQVELAGFTGQFDELDIVATITGPDGAEVATTRTVAPKGCNLARIEVPLPPVEISAPQLWSCETPHLYSVRVRLVHDGVVIDEVTDRFGIRTIDFSHEFGLKINGEKVVLKGVSNHHDMGAVGAAAHERSIERLFIRLKEFGFNHVRTSHNPYSKAFLRLADEHGILVVDELTDKWSDDAWWFGRIPFTELWHQLVPEWIKRDRNHPSVILWSLGNELQMREDLAGFDTNDWGVTTYRIMDLLVRRYDATRKTTVAMFPARANGLMRQDERFATDFTPPELSLVTEVASFNYQYHAYPAYLEQAPHLNIYQSEASTAALTAAFHSMALDTMVGLAYWGAVEYWGESNGWPKKGWNFSFFNHALEPYPQAYLVKSAFTDEPVVHIAVVDSAGEHLNWNDIEVGRAGVSSHWNREPGSRQALFTYTNADEVELFVNGTSLGVQHNNVRDPERRNIIRWDSVEYGNGGTVTAVARRNGVEVARHELQTTGAPTAIRAVVENPRWQADGMDLQYVRCYAVDGEGRVVPTAEVRASVEVTGPAQLIALDNGDHTTDELFDGTDRAFHDGFLMAILRSGSEAGDVHLRLTADGLEPAEVRLETYP